MSVEEKMLFERILEIFFKKSPEYIAGYRNKLLLILIIDIDIN